jgi:hypothetical protein
MSYTYLLDTYAFIQRRLNDVQRQLADAGDDDWKARQFAAGQIEILRDLERFLKAHYDTKLPRRLLLRRSDPHRRT